MHSRRDDDDEHQGDQRCGEPDHHPLDEPERFAMLGEQSHRDAVGRRAHQGAEATHAARVSDTEERTRRLLILRESAEKNGDQDRCRRRVADPHREEHAGAHQRDPNPERTPPHPAQVD